MVTASLVKELRTRTGAGMMDCKKALVENQGDLEKSIDYLRKKGIAKAAKKAGRATQEGLVSSYIHGEGSIGVLLEVNCETDFVARTDDFKSFVKNIAMHIAASAPRWIRSEEVSEEEKAREKEIAIAQMSESGKPQAVLEKIAEGKLGKFFQENCLMEQGYIRDPDKSVDQYLKETIATLGENITIRRFVRFALGENKE